MHIDYSIVLIAVGVAAAVAPVVAQGPADAYTRPIVYRVPGTDGVSVKRDLVFRGSDNAALKMDVYTPEGPAQRRPAVIFVHGGLIPAGTSPKDWGAFRSYGPLAAASGFVGVTFNHRYYTPGDVVTAEADVRAAIDYVRANAAGLGIHADRIAVWAFSAGGPLLAWLLRESPPYARAVVAYYALLDVQQIPGELPAGITQEMLRRYSAVAQLRESKDELPPILVARAGRDMPFVNAAIDRFVGEALTVNARLDLMTHPQGQHGFDVLDDDDRSREIIARTIEFLRGSLGVR